MPTTTPTGSRRLAARAVAFLASGLLAVGLTHAPPAAAAGGHPADGPTVAALRELSGALDLGAASPVSGAREPRRVDVVRDRRGDARTDADLRGPRPYRRLADVTRFRYRTPVRDGGALRVTSTWADLRDASGRGVRRQVQLTYVIGRSEEDLWAFIVTNGDDRVRLYDLGDPSGREQRIRPEKLSVDRTSGPGGTIEVSMSTEWLDVRRVVLQSVTFAGEERAVDATRASRILDAGTRP